MAHFLTDQFEFLRTSNPTNLENLAPAKQTTMDWKFMVIFWTIESLLHEIAIK
ncbi:hypothetical protein [Gelidibacter japonicus]|uniref:hypothetical protein n=1 Tax=Gelidibacter japonicus TaxID=1962232 RepID=UPI0013D0C93B|nr:hypothetical protein [Gelidibacter japonicus]